MDIVEQLIVLRDMAKLSRSDRDLLADACNEIRRLQRENVGLAFALDEALELIEPRQSVG
jgi:hypothetical protein